MIEDCSSFNIRDSLKPMKLEEVKEIQRLSTLPFSIAAINLSGSLNLGMMIRSAVIFGAETFYIIGRKRYDKRSTVGAHNYIDLKFITEDPEEYPHLVLNDILLKYNLAFVEQGGKDINSLHFGKGHLDRCFLFGSESNGVPKKLLEVGIKEAKAEVFSIPQLGVLRSLNVSAAASIIMHKVSMDLKPVEQQIV